MTSLLTKNQKYLFFLLLFLAAGSVAYIINFTTRTSSPSTSSQNPFNVQKLPAALEIKIDSATAFPSVPTSLPYYTISSTSLAPTHLRDKIISDKGLQKKQSYNVYWADADDSAILTESTSPPRLTYSLDPVKKTSLFSGPKKPIDVEAIEAAKSFIGRGIISQYFLETSLLNIDYQKFSWARFTPGTPKDYDVIQVSFFQHVTGFPIRPGQFVFPAISIVVGQNNEILQSEFYYPWFEKLDLVAESTTLTPDEVTQRLQSRQFEITSTNTPEGFDPDLNSISTLYILSSTLEYRSQLDKFLLPYYSFAATALSKDGTESDFTLIVPAILSP